MYHAYFTTQILVTLFQTGYPDNWQKFYTIHIYIYTWVFLLASFRNPVAAANFQTPKRAARPQQDYILPCPFHHVVHHMSMVQNELGTWTLNFITISQILLLMCYGCKLFTPQKFNPRTTHACDLHRLITN